MTPDLCLFGQVAAPQAVLAPVVRVLLCHQPMCFPGCSVGKITANPVLIRAVMKYFN
jgi:hypothetical protein